MLPLQISPSMEKENEKKKKKKKRFSETNKKPSMNKRNREEEEEEEEEESSPPKKDPKLCQKPHLPRLDSFIELNLDTPLPLEWQRCLDIKSGEIHFYNTMTHMRTAKDPRQLITPPPALDLELNLMSDAYEINGAAAEDARAGGRHEKEMVATVCTRCHLLVMMWKESPSCPNCRFEHPPELQSRPPQENKPKAGLLSCRGLRG
ncbi:hypothetical protein KSP40_PGU021501 [Platanthera guangdongensis]|uniref:WW domain-containing protein n=1 Tax=Platanthera guangdongensis TaxID=2320717 RepID=A0ABR2N4Z7_9ASPA